MKITQNLRHRSSSAKGTLDVPLEKILQVLGEPNVDDDTTKVTHSWSYIVDGEHVAIWDYKGHRWSYDGKYSTMVKLFGDKAVHSYV